MSDDHAEVDSVEEASDAVPARPGLAGWSALRLALVVGLAMVVALAALCGWLGYGAYQQRQVDQFRALIVQVARQGAVNLTTVDYERAEADVARILNSATGQFYDDFSNRSAPFIDVLKKVRSKSVGTVTEAGLESVSGREGQVLVAVTVRTSANGAPSDQPRYWRMRITVSQAPDGAAKVAKVDFVP